MCHRQQSCGFKCGWRHSTCCGANSVASSWLRKGWVPFNKTFLKFFLFFKAVELSLFVRVTLYGCGCTPFNWILRKTYRKCSFNDRSRWFQIQKDICHLEDICIVFQLYIPTVNCAVLRTAMVWGEDVSVCNTYSYFFGQGWLSSVWCFPFCWIPAGSAALSQVTPRSLAEGCSSQSGGCYLWTVWI